MWPIMGGRPRSAGRAIEWSDPAKTNAVFVGNSIVVGDNVTSKPGDTWPVKLAAQAPINGALNIANLGHNGAWIPALDTAGDSSAKFQPQCQDNVMFFYEGTNTLKNGNNSASAALGYLRTFITNRLAEHPWKIILVSTIPFLEGATDAMSNQQNYAVEQFNALMKANFGSMGAVAYCDIFSAAPWGVMPDYSAASFNAIQYLFASDRTHPNTVGTNLMANLLAPQLDSIRVS